MWPRSPEKNSRLGLDICKSEVYLESIWGLSGVYPGLSDTVRFQKPVTGLADPDEAGEKERKKGEEESLSFVMILARN